MGTVDRMQFPNQDGRVIEQPDMRVIGWAKSIAPDPELTGKPVVKLIGCRAGHTRWIHVFDHLSDEHLAFCDGRMPGYVYADYLEDFVQDVDPRVLAILREEVVECRTNQPF